MFGLQIGISNLKALREHTVSKREQLSIRFGTLHVELVVDQGFGGKCIILKISREQLELMLKTVALALFIDNSQGKFYAITSLQQLTVEDRVICYTIHFYDERFQIAYDCQLSVQFKSFKKPRMLQSGPFMAADVPMTTQYQSRGEKQADYVPQRKKSLPQTYQRSIISFRSKQQQQKITKLTNKQMAKTAQYLPNNKKSLAEDHGKLWPSQGDIMGIGEDDWQPPMMEFVNEGDHVPPKASMLLTEMSLNREQAKGNRNTIGVNVITEKKTSNEAALQSRLLLDSLKAKVGNYMTKTQEQGQKQEQLTVPTQQQKRAIRQQLQRQRASHGSRETIMLPMAKGDKYELVPLASLTPNEIVEYVQREKKIKKAELELAMESKMRQKEALRSQVPKASKSRKEKETHLRITVGNEQIKEEVSIEQSQSYASDFENLSVTNSALKDRLSARGSRVNQEPLEDEYDQQEFESYSQSMVSRQRPRATSNSDMSQSYKSISNSYRKS